MLFSLFYDKRIKELNCYIKFKILITMNSQYYTRGIFLLSTFMYSLSVINHVLHCVVFPGRWQ